MVDNNAPSSCPRVVIVGAGFGGIAAAQALRGAGCTLTVVDRTNHHLFQPLLYQVATAALSPADIATATRTLLRRDPDARVLMGEVTGVDTECRHVLVADRDPLPYDYLILATGAAYSFFGNDEWADHAAVLKDLTDATGIRERLLAAFEAAEQADDDTARRLLTFVVVGAGPTGVELAGTIAEMTRTTLARDFHHIDPTSARVILCEAGDRVLGAFTEPQSAYAKAALESLGVEVRLGKAVNAIEPRRLVIGDDAIDTTTVLWCAGTRARPAAEWLAADAARNGAVVVGPDCSVPGHADVFAIGDVACYASGDGALPGLAPVAKQQGKYVGRLIAARIAGRPAVGPFRYRDWGTMAVIGRSRAIADFGWMRLTGFPAWLAWSLVHLMLLVDFRSRISVYLNWAWAFFTHKRGARLLTAPSRSRVARLARGEPD